MQDICSLLHSCGYMHKADEYMNIVLRERDQISQANEQQFITFKMLLLWHLFRFSLSSLQAWLLGKKGHSIVHR